MDDIWLKLENIVAKGEIARFEQFLLLSLCFQKAVCCRGVPKVTIWGKGLRQSKGWSEHKSSEIPSCTVS